MLFTHGRSTIKNDDDAVCGEEKEPQGDDTSIRVGKEEEKEMIRAIDGGRKGAWWRAGCLSPSAADAPGELVSLGVELKQEGEKAAQVGHV